MKRSVERMLCTHTGSLVRPRELRPLTSSIDSTADDRADRWNVLERCIDDVVAKQASVGLDIVNDGEFGKSGWANYVLDRITGFSESATERTAAHWLGSDAERFPEVINAEFPGFRKGLPALCCTSSISYVEDEGLRRGLASLGNAASRVSVEEVFSTAVSPGSAMFNGINQHYTSEREYIFALADALRTEYLAIHQAGMIVQIDDALLANMYEHLTKDSPKAYWQWAELRIEALNHALRGIPQNRIRYHVCFGSWHGPHTSDAPLAAIVGLLLQVNAGAYLIEAANPRHEHEWRVWQDTKLPDGKILIPGVVTHHTGVVEHPQVVADRIVRYAQIVGRESVIAGTDCGFAQTERLQRVPAEVMWAKLASLAEGARLATQELWGKALEPVELRPQQPRAPGTSPRFLMKL